VYFKRCRGDQENELLHCGCVCIDDAFSLGCLTNVAPDRDRLNVAIVSQRATFAADVLDSLSLSYTLSGRIISSSV